MHGKPPTFDNQIATLRITGPEVDLKIERTRPAERPTLETSLSRRLA